MRLYVVVQGEVGFAGGCIGVTVDTCLDLKGCQVQF